MLSQKYVALCGAGGKGPAMRNCNFWPFQAAKWSKFSGPTKRLDLGNACPMVLVLVHCQPSTLFRLKQRSPLVFGSLFGPQIDKIGSAA